MTLAQLQKLTSVIGLRKVCALADLNEKSIRSRLRRGQPELTADESKAIASVLTNAGLTFCSYRNGS